jgi:ASC-1-like (ASCH) protein
MSQTIEKKVLAEYFDQILSGQKTFELRLADWQCQPGDTLILHEVDNENRQPTGRSLRKRVGYVLHTKELQLFSEADVEQYGYQVISLIDEVSV